MPSKTKTVLLAGACLVLGAAAGLGVSSYITQDGVKTYAAYELAEQESVAVDAFATLDPRSVVVFERALLAYVERQHRMNWISSQEFYRVSGYTRARLAQGLSELGDADAAGSELDVAVSDLSRAGVPAAKDELQRALRKLRPAAAGH